MSAEIPKEVIFWGATGQAKVLRDCLRDSGSQLVALFDNNETLASPFADVPIYCGKEGLDHWIATRRIKGQVGFLVAIGGDRGRERVEIQEYLEARGLVALVAKHSTAFVAGNASIGKGSQILAQSAVCVEAALGRGCIINTGATVDHECRLGDGVHIGPGAHVAGCVDIENFSTVYTGAIVLPRMKIGEGATVGAGAVVTEDVPPYSVVVGNPARILRETGERV